MWCWKCPENIASWYLPNKLLLFYRAEAILSGVCLLKITETFPIYPFQGKIKNDRERFYRQYLGNPRDLPADPKSIGICVNIINGINLSFNFPSMSRNSDGVS